MSCQPDTPLSDNVPLFRLSYRIADSERRELALQQQDSHPEDCLAKRGANSGSI